MFCCFAVVHLHIVLRHQRQTGVVNVIVVVAKAAQTGHRMVSMEKAFFLVVGVTAQEKADCEIWKVIFHMWTLNATFSILQMSYIKSKTVMTCLIRQPIWVY